MTRQEQLDAITGRNQPDAITAYLAEVPLPEGWREDAVDMPHRIMRYHWKPAPDDDDADPDEIECVMASDSGVKVWSLPSHWPAIPQAVLVRAAVQCHRLREGQ